MKLLTRPILNVEYSRNEVEVMGRGDHNRSKGTNFLAQTPKHQVSDGIDVEYSEELADHDDVVARERSKAADRRAKQK